MKMSLPAAAVIFSVVLTPDWQAAAAEVSPRSISGRYPHLTMFNHQNECGIGALAVWADKLWAITYAPHKPLGSDDKLYSIDRQLRLTAHPKSVGGTPAGRMIHLESDQLIIGPYFIDAEQNVRVVKPRDMPGRITAIARHLEHPERLVYVVDMEGKIYEVDVKTLAVKKLFHKPVPGWHSKGAYTAADRLVFSNNGDRAVSRFKKSPYLVGADPQGPDEAGLLAEYDGRKWNIVARRQYTEVTGPRGIRAKATPGEPLWSVGWDRRSLLLSVLHEGQWTTYRLPKADFSYDGRHGWHTEWPRIREVVPGEGERPPRLLMNMHGGWFDFPKAFRPGNTAGLKPLGAYLKITADFCRWQDRIVFACDDVSKFANPLVNQAQSNLWFAAWEELSRKGAPAGYGGPWVNDDVKAGETSRPYLFTGYRQRVLHLAHQSPHSVDFTIEIDRQGDGRWEQLQTAQVPPNGYHYHIFPAAQAGQWLRLKCGHDAKAATAYFHYGPSAGAVENREPFRGLADIDQQQTYSVGIVRPRGGDLGTLQLLAKRVNPESGPAQAEYYELDADLKLRRLPEKTEEADYLKTRGTVKELDFM